MSLTHDDISEHLRKKLGGSVSSLESLKAEGGGSRSSLNESLNLDDFENDTVIWSFFDNLQTSSNESTICFAKIIFSKKIMSSCS